MGGLPTTSLYTYMAKKLLFCQKRVFFLRNSIVYSPTTVHFTNKYGCFGLITHKLTILLFGVIQVSQGIPLSLPSLVLL
jgi:hypothetical protein